MDTGSLTGYSHGIVKSLDTAAGNITHVCLPYLLGDWVSVLSWEKGFLLEEKWQPPSIT